jgi:hypothetical protein
MLSPVNPTASLPAGSANSGPPSSASAMAVRRRSSSKSMSLRDWNSPVGDTSVLRIAAVRPARVVLNTAAPELTIMSHAMSRSVIPSPRREL